MLKGIRFGNPEYLYFLLAIPLLAAWYFYRLRKSNADIRFSSTLGFEGVRTGVRIYLYHGLYVLRLLAILLLIVALARPQTNLSRQDITVEGIDIVIAMDISGSMTAMDFKPNRLEASKNLAMEFIDGRPNDRIGLVVFSGESFTQCPLTTDHAVLKNLFGEIKSGMIEDGTAIGDGLATAVARLKDSKAISKVIILLTDGVNNMGSVDPLSAAELAKMFGLRIYTVGIGTNGVAPIPVQTPFGVQIQSMPVQIDEDLLRKIAAMTDGKYFRATNNLKLRQVYQEIDRLEKSKIDVTEFRKKKEEFLLLVILAAGLLSLEVILRNTYFRNIP
ncbi:MAG TPA: VWA domain-containing protein [Bacteroidales bacterium]|nr:VWA domain-containing protein [Bacteroidales bacterium]